MQETNSPNHSAQQRYEVMKSSFDLEPVVAFAVRDGYLPDEAKASRAFDGLLQWLAGHAVEEHPEHPYVMMNGEVDQAFHALILNTRTYLHFCRNFVGFFIHHTPLTDTVLAEYNIMSGVDYTVDYLAKAYGDNLAPALQGWVRAHQQGELTAAAVSCVSNGPDRAPHDMIGIRDFRRFWDTEARAPVGTA